MGESDGRSAFWLVLSALIETDVLPAAAWELAAQGADRGVSQAAASAKRCLMLGGTLSDAMLECADAFSAFERAAIRTGERSNAPAAAARRLGAFFLGEELPQVTDPGPPACILTTGNDYSQDFGWSADVKAAFLAATKRYWRGGMLLVTGPAPSGRITILHYALRYYSRPDVRIMTVERAVTDVIDGVTHGAIDAGIGRTAPVMLRSILPIHADFIMIDELDDDRETAGLAVEAAAKGQFVLTSLSAEEPAAALLRLLEMGARPDLLASGLKLILAQRLVRRLCRSCKKPGGPGGRFIRWCSERDLALPEQVCEAKGCPECGFTGYRGHIPVNATLTVNEELRGLLADGAPEDELRLAARKAQGITFAQDALRKVEAGVLSPEELERALGGL